MDSWTGGKHVRTEQRRRGRTEVQEANRVDRADTCLPAEGPTCARVDGRTTVAHAVYHCTDGAHGRAGRLFLHITCCSVRCAMCC